MIVLSDEEFNKEALLKAGQLAQAASNVLYSHTCDLGNQLNNMKKVLDDYNNFIFNRVNEKHGIKS